MMWPAVRLRPLPLTPSCAGYDDGDCCEESCVVGEFSCGADDDFYFYFYCLDPNYASADDDYPVPDDDSCEDETIGNGYCNPRNNNKDCGTPCSSR